MAHQTDLPSCKVFKLTLKYCNIVLFYFCYKTVATLFSYIVFVAVVCPNVSIIARANYTCRGGNNFRSVCWYTCEDGYDMPPAVSKTIVCTKNGTWSGYGLQACIGKQAGRQCVIKFHTQTCMHFKVPSTI